MTLKDTITRELLDGVLDPPSLEETFRKHRRSKGPFYLALSEATLPVQQHLSDLSLSYSELKSQWGQTQAEMGAQEAQCRDLEKKVQTLDDQLADREAQLTQV